MGMFKLFADLIAFHLDAQEKIASTEMELLEARKTSQLRDQFIAILGHDLGNPVGAILNVSQLLLRMPLDERTKRLANILQNSSYRMKALIENILDFARGRLGEGIILKRNDNEPISEMLEQVIAELAILWPDRTINTNFRVKCAINCDGRRVSQVLSNLLGNAIAHGSKDTPVNVDVVCDADDFSISVTNSGSQIPDAVREKLFEPFSRGDDQGKDGLGLGLYIAAEIARAHSGTLTVKSDEHSTAFTFKMPVN